MPARYVDFAPHLLPHTSNIFLPNKLTLRCVFVCKAVGTYVLCVCVFTCVCLCCACVCLCVRVCNPNEFVPNPLFSKEWRKLGLGSISRERKTKRKKIISFFSSHRWRLPEKFLAISSNSVSSNSVGLFKKSLKKENKFDFRH